MRNKEEIRQIARDNNLKIASVYGDIIKEDGRYKTTGRSRTGCIFCMFGINFDETTIAIKVQRRKESGCALLSEERENDIGFDFENPVFSFAFNGR